MLKKIIVLLLLISIIVPATVFGLGKLTLGKMSDSSINTEDLETINYRAEKGIKNILIMGSDAREGETVSRSDSMMLLTIDTNNNCLKLTSFARDAFVDVPGHGYTKLTHAYAYGKEELLIKTIEQNFKIDINDFVFVDFKSFMSIIDVVGGINVEVTSGELDELNKFIPETYSWDTNPDKGEIKYVENTGMQTLNAYQALSFARIRKNDTAFKRDERQRLVMKSLISEVKDLPFYKYPGLMKSISPYVKTNMSSTDMILTGLSILKIGSESLKQMEFPIVDPPGYSTGGVYGNYGWVLRYDESSVDILQKFIYEAPTNE